MQIIPLEHLKDRIGAALSALGRLLPGAGNSQKPDSDERAIGIRSDVGERTLLPKAKYWSAVDRPKPEASFVNALRDCFSVASRMAISQPLNEGTTGAILIDPILNALGYWAYQKEIQQGGYRLDYLMADQRVGLEIKRATASYDQITGPNSHKNFATAADQIITYLKVFELKAMLYSNGRFWWRVESDEMAERLFALRFNMNLAYNQLRNYGTSRDLEYFFPMFHADAFREGNNYSVPIRIGRSQNIEPHGVVWMKDLNQGFGSFEL
jgi:hypothetical protein